MGNSANRIISRALFNALTMKASMRNAVAKANPMGSQKAKEEQSY